KIVYSINQATNGAFGGPVGLEQFTISNGQRKNLVANESVSAVPCPSDRGKGFQGGMGSSTSIHLTTTFPPLLFRIEHDANEVFVPLGTPMPKTGDMYLASNYDLRLLAISDQTQLIQSFGKQEMTDLSDFNFQAESDGRLMICKEHWDSFSLASNAMMPQSHA